MKKLFALLSTALAVTVLLAGCSGGGTTADGLNVGMVTDTGGVNDKSFNQGTYEGIEKFIAENGGKASYIESKSENDFIPNLNAMAAKNDVVVASGFLFEEALKESTAKNPDTKFVGIDVAIEGIDNLNSIVFAEEEAGYLAGVTAALTTKTNKVGFIGGMEVPAVQKFGWGFVAGVNAVNPDIQITYEYSGSFTDTALGKTKASAMYQSGIDIIFAAAGGVGVGVINEGKERAEAGENVWVVGVDRDQYEDGVYGSEGKSVILTSAVKKVDVASETALQQIKDGTFQGGKITRLTMADDAVGLPAENPNVPAETMTKVNEYVEKVKSGEVKVPGTIEEVKVFKVNGTL